MPTILGANGQPAWRDGKPVMQEIASIERDVAKVFYGRMLTNEDETLVTRGGGKGLKIYDELKRDAHAGSVLGKRKLAVTSRPWDVKPASDKRVDKKAAELVKGALEHLRFNALCKRLLEATLKGYSVAEVMWELRDGAVLPQRVLARAPGRFRFNVDGELHLITRENMVEGELMPPRKFIVHRRGADDDNPYGTGIGGMLFWPVFFKRNTITFWLTFADKFGSPTALGKYPTGSGKPEQDKLLQALAAISQDAGVIVPEGMVIELLEAARSGTIDTYEKLVRYMDEQMSKAVLGETMSTTAASAGLGSTQASVHNDVRLEVAKDDGNELDETLNDSLVKWIVEFNMPGAGLPKVERSFEEPEDLEKRAKRDQTLVQMGFEPSEDYILETYGEGWSRKAPQEPVVVPPQDTLPPAPGSTAEDPAEPEGDEAAFSEGTPLQRAARARNAGAQDALVAAADAASAQWKALMGRRVEDLLSVLDETGDLVQFRERMDKLLDVEPDPKAIEAIARATFAANLAGRTATPRKKLSLMGRAVAALSALKGRRGG